MTVKTFLTAVSLKDTRLTTPKAAEGPLQRSRPGPKRKREPPADVRRPILVPFVDSGALSKNISRKDPLNRRSLHCAALQPKTNTSLPT
jgi:hypothetical protein